MVPGFAFVLAKMVALDKDVCAVPIVVVFTLVSFKVLCSVHMCVQMWVMSVTTADTLTCTRLRISVIAPLWDSAPRV